MIRKRMLFDEVMKWVDSEKIIIIKGARQVGKTTLLLSLKDHLSEAGNQTVYVSADDLMFKKVFESSSLFFKYLKFEHNIERNAYVFIDEFQYINDAGIFVKILFDTVKRENLNIRFIVSGSSSLEISKNREFLTGRKVEFELFPFSFIEAMASEKRYRVKFNIYTDFGDMIDFYNLYKDDIEAEMANYIRWGGYPEIYLEKDPERKRILFDELISTYIEKDIAGFLHIANVKSFNNLIKVLAGQIGNLVNKSELSGTLGINYKTLGSYLDVLEGTYVFSYVQPYFTNVRKELTQMPKVYIHDTGVYYHYYGDKHLGFETIEGKVIENFVYNTFKIQYPNDVYFYRTKEKMEIDFVIKGSGMLLPVEVKFRKRVPVSDMFLRFMDNNNTNQG
ncbi:MAG: ATP-binding protein, partial [Candidatus Omnitrophota bacterium]